MTEPDKQLPDKLYQRLQHERFVLLHTIAEESGTPTSNAISWIYAVNSSKLRLAVDARSKLVANMRANPQAAVTVFAAGTVYAIYGQAVIVTEALADVPIKLACFDIAISEVREAMFYGARITVEPEFVKTYDKRAADRLDNQVFAAMRKA
jgi:hypothetical protein